MSATDARRSLSAASDDLGKRSQARSHVRDRVLGGSPRRRRFGGACGRPQCCEQDDDGSAIVSLDSGGKVNRPVERRSGGLDQIRGGCVTEHQPLLNERRRYAGAGLVLIEYQPEHDAVGGRLLCGDRHGRGGEKEQAEGEGLHVRAEPTLWGNLSDAL
jgi:hypothetical protein